MTVDAILDEIDYVAAAPSVTMLCTTLRHLDISCMYVPDKDRNAFVSALARQLRAMPRLRRFAAQALYLESAHVLEMLSPADSMPHLRHLDLSCNDDFECDAEHARLICARTGLRGLRLEECAGQTDAGVAEFVRCISAGALAQMQRLALPMPVSCAALVASFATLTRLSALSLGSSDWNDEAAAAMAHVFAALPRLRSFSYSDFAPQQQVMHPFASRLRNLTVAAFDPRQAELLSQGLACVPQLQRLEFGHCYNQMDSVTCSELLSRVGELTELTELHLGAPFCSTPHAAAVCAMYAALPSLVHLTVCLAAVTQVALAELLSTMPTRLTFLHLTFGGGFPEDAEIAWVLPAALQLPASLHTLVLHGYGLVGSHIAALAPAIGGFTLLRRLMLRGFKVNMSSACALAPYVARLQWLTHCTIGSFDDSLGHDSARALALHFKRLPRLQCLDLRDRDTLITRVSYEVGVALQAALQVNGGVEVRVA